MSVMVIVGVIAILCGCSKEVTVISVREALQQSMVGIGSRVRVAGYYFSHFEGDSLESRPGEGSPLGIALAASNMERAGSTHFAEWKGYDGSYVVVSGILRRGPFLGGGPAGLIPDICYLEVSSVERANQGP
jgi:hypothetical protein